MTTSLPLNVVHVSSVHPATDSRIFEKECQSLAAAGHQVTLIATGEPPTDHGDVRVITRNRSQRRLVRFTFGAAWAVWRAYRLRPDVVHLHDPELIPFGVLLSFTRSRVVYDAHEDLLEQIEHKHYLNRITRRTSTAIARIVLLLISWRMDAVIGATTHITDRFNNPLKATVHNFPIITAFRTAEPEAIYSGRLVYVGGISEVRGIREMVKATRILAARGVILHLAGPVDNTASQLIEEAQAEGLVVYHGVLDRSSVSTLLASCAVGLAVLHPVPNYVNGKPTKLFEYMAAGIPSTVSDFPLWREMVLPPRAGVVADPTSPVAIAEAVAGLLDSPERAREMGRNGRTWVEHHRNWESEATALVELYSSLSPGATADET